MADYFIEQLQKAHAKKLNEAGLGDFVRGAKNKLTNKVNNIKTRVNDVTHFGNDDSLRMVVCDGVQKFLDTKMKTLEAENNKVENGDGETPVKVAKSLQDSEYNVLTEIQFFGKDEDPHIIITADGVRFDFIIDLYHDYSNDDFELKETTDDRKFEYHQTDLTPDIIVGYLEKIKF